MICCAEWFQNVDLGVGVKDQGGYFSCENKFDNQGDAHMICINLYQNCRDLMFINFNYDINRIV